MLITALKSHNFYKTSLADIVFSVLIKKQIYYYITNFKNILVTTCQNNLVYFMHLKYFSEK